MMLQLAAMAGGLALGTLSFFKFGHRIFKKNLNAMEPMIKGFAIASQENIEKVRKIGIAFFTGYNAMLEHKDLNEIRMAAEALPPFYAPFCYEGSAMGFSPKAFLSLKYSRGDFEKTMLSINPNYAFLYFIGLGFWYGFRYRHSPRKVEKLIARIDRSELKYLVMDGYGFKHGFFDYLKNPKVRDKGLEFHGYARNTYYQGFGRALWFVFMEAPGKIFEHIALAPEPYREDCYAGLGVAVAFTNINNLKFAFDFAGLIEERYRPHFYLGASIAVYTRYLNDRDYFEEQVGRLEPSYQALARRAVEINQSAFQMSMAVVGDNSYLKWREYILNDVAGEFAGSIR